MEASEVPDGSPRPAPFDEPDESSYPGNYSYGGAPERTLSIPVTFGGETRSFALPAGAVLGDLVSELELAWPEYRWAAAKFIAPPPQSLLKADAHAAVPLPALAPGKKLRAMATKLSVLEAKAAAAAAHSRREQRRRVPTPRTWSRAAPDREAATYTFLDIRPLPNLPAPERSLAFLRRLAQDAGVRAAMRRHRFTVGLLTEMDPAAYTESTHEGTTRILGLNRNRGEVIELRLRTDAGDGYRDYRTIRRTLCHELAHNVHGPHDRAFWDLCHQIEREVDEGDYRSGGRTVDGDPAERAPPPGRDEEFATDHGGWEGGEFVLGGRAPAGAQGEAPLTRREILARAAEERSRRMKEQVRDEERRRDNGEGSSSGAARERRA